MKIHASFSRSILLALTLALLLSAFYLTCVVAGPAINQFLDPAFNGNGRVLIPIPGSSQIAREVAIQPDGKLLITGYDNWQTSNNDVILARVNPDGSMDKTFGAGGKVITALTPGDDAGYAVAVQPDGKIVVAGLTQEGGGAVAMVMRYNADGSLDATFGNHGVVTTNFQPKNSWFLSVAVLDDGRILASGSVNSDDRGFLLARFKPNGDPDPTLGGHGVVTATLPGGDLNGWDMAIQPDGKVVLGGYFTTNGDNSDLALMRFNVDGSLDAGFGSHGVVTQDISAVDYAYGVVVQSDGKIVLGGRVDRTGLLARYNSDGSYDNSFGNDAHANYVQTSVPGYGSASFIEIARRADDGIAAATLFSSGKPPVAGITLFDRAGRPDMRIAPGGVITTTNDGHLASDYAILVQPDQKIVLAGHVDMDDTQAYDYDLALWRYDISREELFLPIITK